MRLERMIVVVVLATGFLAGGVVRAAPPKAAPATELAPNPGGPSTPLLKETAKSKDLGAEHKILGAFAGRWKMKMHVLQDSATTPAQDTGGPPDSKLVRSDRFARDTEGTADGKLVMGGRFAQVTREGLLYGQPFEGMMLLGFDNVVNRYTSIWVDNASNGIVQFVGTFDAAKKQLTMTAHYSDPTTRRLTLARIVLTFVDADSWVYDEYIAHAVGEKETHTMSVTYSRG